MKTPAERSIEVLTWASVAIWLGFVLVAGIMDYIWLVVLMLSIILLSSAIYQRSRGWHTSLSMWVFGIWMAVFAVLELVSEIVAAINDGETLDIGLGVYLGIALVSMGVAAVFRTIQGPDLSASGRAAGRRDQTMRDYDPRDRDRYVPRRVEEDLSSGWIPSPQESADYSRPTGRYDTRATGRVDTRATGRRSRDAYAEDDYAQADPARTQRYQQDSFQTGWTDRRAPEPTTREQTANMSGARQRRQQRQQPPRQRATAPTDLESRVEDIIRRSRDRRTDVPDDELGY